MARGNNGFEIKILSDTEGFERGIRDGVIDPLDDADAALEQLGDAADAAGREAGRGLEKAGDSVDDLRKELDKAGRQAKDTGDDIEQLGDDARTAGRDSERGIDRLEDALKDAQRQSEKTERAVKDIGDAGRDAGRDAERGMKRAEDGVEDFKQEASSTAREAAASFDGSADSIGDAFQEVAANAFAGFGPAGEAAGLAAAVGIGLAAAGFQDVQEAQEESEARAAEWADAFIESGQRVLTSAQSTAAALAILTDPERYKEATQNAKDWGVSTETAIAAMTGETWALDEASGALQKRLDDARGNAEGFEGVIHATGSTLNGTSTALLGAEKRLQLIKDEFSDAGRRADEYSRYLLALAEHTEGATTKVDEFGDSIVTLPDGKEIYIDAETGQATDNVDAIQNKIYGVKGKSVSVNVNGHVNMSAADRGMNRWISQNNGRTVKIYGRYVSPPGSDIP